MPLSTSGNKTAPKTSNKNATITPSTNNMTTTTATSTTALLTSDPVMHERLLLGVGGNKASRASLSSCVEQFHVFVREYKNSFETTTTTTTTKEATATAKEATATKEATKETTTTATTITGDAVATAPKDDKDSKDNNEKKDKNENKDTKEDKTTTTTTTTNNNDNVENKNATTTTTNTAEDEEAQQEAAAERIENAKQELKTLVELFFLDTMRLSNRISTNYTNIDTWQTIEIPRLETQNGVEVQQKLDELQTQLLPQARKLNEQLREYHEMAQVIVKRPTSLKLQQELQQLTSQQGQLEEQLKSIKNASQEQQTLFHSLLLTIFNLKESIANVQQQQDVATFVTTPSKRKHNASPTQSPATSGQKKKKMNH